MSRSLATVIAANIQPCTAPGCRRMRHGAAHFCVAHKKRRQRWGHANGRRIERTEYKAERKAVERLFAAHPTHQGVAVAVEWIQDLMRDATAGRKRVPGRREFARLAQHNVEPMAVLVEVCAFYLHTRNRPAILPDDDDGTVLRLQLAAAILGLAPRHVRSSWKAGVGQRVTRTEPLRRDREEIGQAIRDRLLPLLVNVAEATIQHERMTARAREAMSDSFIHALPQPERKSA